MQAREIAEIVGAGLKLPVVSVSPEEAQEHFGWFAIFAGRDMPASSEDARSAWLAADRAGFDL